MVNGGSLSAGGALRAELIRAALRAVIVRGRGLEINTSPWSKGMDETLPGGHNHAWYRELGGEVLVFGSDAHCPEAVGQHFARARDLALSFGLHAPCAFCSAAAWWDGSHC